MSLKPPKKSDLDKNWMKRRCNKGILINPEYHLIVTEGEKTEPSYFKAVKEIINKKYRKKIQLEIVGTGGNTLGIIDKARKYIRNSNIIYKHVWIVYDTDDFPAERVNATAEKCQEISTNDTEYHAIWSNQCVELWYLLHFEYMQSDMDRKQYFTKLDTYLENIGQGKYEKNRNDMYDILKPYMDTALQNAKKLDENNRGRTPWDSAPGTKVYEIIEHLKPYL